MVFKDLVPNKKDIPYYSTQGFPWDFLVGAPFLNTQISQIKSAPPPCRGVLFLNFQIFQFKKPPPHLGGTL